MGIKCTRGHVKFTARKRRARCFRVDCSSSALPPRNDRRSGYFGRSSKFIHLKLAGPQTLTASLAPRTRPYSLAIAIYGVRLEFPSNENRGSPSHAIQIRQPRKRFIRISPSLDYWCQTSSDVAARITRGIKTDRAKPIYSSNFNSVATVTAR